jgi:hypothetical protein
MGDLKTEKTPAWQRFDALVRERRARLHPKERNDPAQVFHVAELRQVVGQLNFELAAGIRHDPADVAGLQAYADEFAAAISAKVAAAKPQRFRGVGR